MALDLAAMEVLLRNGLRNHRWNMKVKSAEQAENSNANEGDSKRDESTE